MTFVYMYEYTTEIKTNNIRIHMTNMAFRQ